MKKPQRTTKPPRTPRIKADHHKDDLRVLATSSPAKLAARPDVRWSAAARRDSPNDCEAKGTGSALNQARWASLQKQASDSIPLFEAQRQAGTQEEGAAHRHWPSGFVDRNLLRI